MNKTKQITKRKAAIIALGIFFASFIVLSANIQDKNNNTSWGLQGIKSSQVEVFHDNISSHYWDLVGASNFYFETPYSERHNYLLDNCTFEGLWNYTGTSYYIGDQDIFPEGFYWDGTSWWMIGSDSDEIHKYYSNWTYTGISYDISGQCTTPTDIFWDGTNWWVLGDGVFDRVYQYYSNWTYTGISHYLGGQEPAPKGIFWDGTNWWVVGLNNRIVYQYNSAWSYTGISHYIGGQDGYPSDLFWDGTNWWVSGVNTDTIYKYNSDWSYTGISYYIGGEDGGPTDLFWDGISWWMLGYFSSRVYKYGPDFCNISKNYFGNGYTYMQTNTTETIALQSADYGTHYNLSNDYYFEVEFETNSGAQIDLILLKDGIVNKTLILSQSGNTDFSQRTIQISLNENAEFDQLKISGTLEDTDYVRIYDIKVKIEVPPTITINSPTLNEIFGTSAPSFNVEIYDANLDSIWYTLDNGLTNTTFTTNGTINQALWDALPEGNVIIRFYANNTLGRIGFQEVTVVKTISQPSPPGIPGYNILLLLGIVSTTAIIIIRKKLNHLK